MADDNNHERNLGGRFRDVHLGGRSEAERIQRARRLLAEGIEALMGEDGGVIDDETPVRILLGFLQLPYEGTAADPLVRFVAVRKMEDEGPDGWATEHIVWAADENAAYAKLAKHLGLDPSPVDGSINSAVFDWYQMYLASGVEVVR
jgi:hypothetical protein